jgi:hypothetical protein
MVRLLIWMMINNFTLWKICHPNLLQLSDQAVNSVSATHHHFITLIYKRPPHTRKASKISRTSRWYLGNNLLYIQAWKALGKRVLRPRRKMEGMESQISTHRCITVRHHPILYYARADIHRWSCLWFSLPLATYLLYVMLPIFPSRHAQLVHHWPKLRLAYPWMHTSCMLCYPFSPARPVGTSLT